MTERALQRDVVLFLRKAGWTVYILSGAPNTRGKRGRRQSLIGLPDLYAMHPAKHRATWVELKTPHGHLRPGQAQFRDMAQSVGIEWWYVDSIRSIASWA